MTDWALHDALVDENNGLSPRARREGQQRLVASLSERERSVFLSTGTLPYRNRSSASRWIVDESHDGRPCHGPRFGREAVRVFDELKRRGGSARRSVVYNAISGIMRGFIGDAIGDLRGLGLLREVHDRGDDTVLQLTAGFEDLGLVSEWSRASP